MTQLHVNVIVSKDGSRRSLGHIYQSATHAAIAALGVATQVGEHIEPAPFPFESGARASARYRVRPR